MDKESKAFELNCEQLAQVTGGHVNSPGRTCQLCKEAVLVYGGYDETNGLYYSFCPNPSCRSNNGPYVDSPHRFYYM